jgi:hypothetical protein
VRAGVTSGVVQRIRLVIVSDRQIQLPGVLVTG